MSKPGSKHSSGRWCFFPAPSHSCSALANPSSLPLCTCLVLQHTILGYLCSSASLNALAHDPLSYLVGTQCDEAVRRTEAQAFSVQAGNQDWVSLIECVSSNGTTLPPYFIFKGKQIQQAWLDSITDGQAVLQVSDNGWTTYAIGPQWLEAFDLHTKTQTQGTHRLLILDGHESHVSSDFIQYCCDHSIVALCLPPHSTHLLQPLDVGVYGPLSKAYKKCVHHHSRYGAVNVNKIDFLRYYQEARSTAITTHNILSAWRGAGLIPFNPSVVISKLPLPKTPPYASFTNSNEVQVNIAVTPSTATESISLWMRS